ncbi:MAG: hypothetical protein O2794_03440 [bacterium]|nr:hypothetical protein [bacterium]
MVEFGDLNGHSIGIIMRELCMRAMFSIRQERFKFVSTEKRGYSGDMDDLVTTADHAAQSIYLNGLTECFPDYGIIAEEEDFRREGDLYFTVDPLDGTKAFARGQSHGVGSMISLSSGSEVIGAVVGDVNTLEMYYYRPGSDNVWHIVFAGGEMSCHELKPNIKAPLDEQYILFRQNPIKTSRNLKRLSEKYFRDIAVAEGSIGVSMARLWKGEVGAHVIPAHHQTPWDWNPCLGISRKLGFEFYAIHPHSGEPSIETGPITRPLKAIIETHFDILVTHKSWPFFQPY